MLEVIGLHEYALITAFRAVFGGRPDRILLLKRGHPAHDSERFAVITATTSSAVSIPVVVVPPASHQFVYADCLHRYGSISAPQRGREAVARDGDVTGQAGSRHRLVRQLGLHRRSLRDPRALPLGASDGLAKAVPYGVYNIAANAGWVNLGITHDTAAFAVESIRRWWHALGAARYPAATRLLIIADCGGSNGVRVRLWKRKLQGLADELGIAITVCHLPSGTTKWNCPIAQLQGESH